MIPPAPILAACTRPADKRLAPLPSASAETGWRVVAAGIYRATLMPDHEPLTGWRLIVAIIEAAAVVAPFLFAAAVMR